MITWQEGRFGNFAKVYYYGDDMSAINERIIDEFRANQGRVGGQYAERTLLLLHTRGAKSGQERVNPLGCFSDHDRLVVVAARAGADVHPDWYYNMLATPLVTV